jgi:hypothetical protein
MSNTIRLRCSGQEYRLSFDLEQMKGDALEVLEEHLGGDSVFVWLERWVSTLEQGMRIRDLRTRDILGLLYLARAQQDPGVRWEDVARGVAPYTLEVIADEEPVPDPSAPNLGLAVADLPTLSPTLAELGPPGAHEAPGEPPTGVDLFRTP